MGQLPPIYRGLDFYVPHFRILVERKELEPQIVNDILSVTYTDNVKEIDRFDLTINNWDEEHPTFRDAKARTFKYSDGTTFDPGRTVEIWMGYFGDEHMRLMMRGSIERLQPNFPQDGASTLTVSGLNAMHKLRGKQRSERYENLTDSQIARRIAGALRLEIETNPKAAAKEVTYPYVLQEQEYDLVFLLKRARRLGYDLFVKENRSGKSVLYFGPSTGTRAPQNYELIYGESLLDFTPSLITANQVGKVRFDGWDHKAKKPISAEATWGDLTTKGVGSRGRQSVLERSFRTREEVIRDAGVETVAEGKQVAVERMENIAKEMLKGSGSTIGVPDLRAGSIVEIGGLGERFSGRYFVTSTTHTIDDGGYKTKFDCRREEIRG